MPRKVPTSRLLRSRSGLPSTTLHLELQPVSRRTFLSVAAGAIAVRGCTARSHPRPVGTGRTTGRKHACILLDAQQHCALSESIRGYELALRPRQVRRTKASTGWLPSAKIIIIPACLALAPETVRHVVAALEAGTCVIIESGAGFVQPAIFTAHQEWLRRWWGLGVETPVRLWVDRDDTPGHQRSEGRLSLCNLGVDARAPYVDIRWPLCVKVRDFSRIVPVSGLPEQVVGWCGDWPIASKRPWGKGLLVFLGSPLGPALYAGDAEAHRWLSEVIAL